MVNEKKWIKKTGEREIYWRITKLFYIHLSANVMYWTTSNKKSNLTWTRTSLYLCKFLIYYENESQTHTHTNTHMYIKGDPTTWLITKVGLTELGQITYTNVTAPLKPLPREIHETWFSKCHSIRTCYVE